MTTTSAPSSTSSTPHDVPKGPRMPTNDPTGAAQSAGVTAPTGGWSARPDRGSRGAGHRHRDLSPAERRHHVELAVPEARCGALRRLDRERDHIGSLLPSLHHHVGRRNERPGAPARASASTSIVRPVQVEEPDAGGLEALEHHGRQLSRKRKPSTGFSARASLSEPLSTATASTSSMRARRIGTGRRSRPGQPDQASRTDRLDDHGPQWGVWTSIAMCPAVTK